VSLEPLWAIRLRTPRLELRLPTDEELEELYEVAAAGIHPPEEMPFAVAWTDDLQHDAFVEFHRAAWREWSAAKWRCNLVTFLDRRVIGMQGFEAADFARSRTVETGSWLGAEFQRRGFGTEQRAAVLELAFRGLGAHAVTSGALFPNVASQRVSQKLGYRVVGTSEVSPRGEPVQHYDYRLERAEWQCPVPVEIVGLEPALGLFGAAPRA
jgi:RimJ/RimL family protein N-acetyltransferase